MERRICVGLIYVSGFVVSYFCSQSLTSKTKKMEFLTDLWDFLKVRKKWWLLPIIIVLLLIGILVVIGGSTAAAPFVYTLF